MAIVKTNLELRELNKIDKTKTKENADNSKNVFCIIIMLSGLEPAIL